MKTLRELITEELAPHYLTLQDIEAASINQSQLDQPAINAMDDLKSIHLYTKEFIFVSAPTNYRQFFKPIPRHPPTEYKWN